MFFKALETVKNVKKLNKVNAIHYQTDNNNFSLMWIPAIYLFINSLSVLFFDIYDNLYIIIKNRKKMDTLMNRSKY